MGGCRGPSKPLHPIFSHNHYFPLCQMAQEFICSWHTIKVFGPFLPRPSRSHPDLYYNNSQSILILLVQVFAHPAHIS